MMMMMSVVTVVEYVVVVYDVFSGKTGQKSR